ncbi:unnamed protein product [Caenorhabditis bovis]|uniref:non-specific serine/threonine protein kinase n=1 Tax=Caenorhabditis bovis TaxID=2654633 RepID=A0A8S1EDK8_9PELO|nr:unnamed protein product [Caenorhabditis bovis]
MESHLTVDEIFRILQKTYSNPGRVGGGLMTDDEAEKALETLGKVNASILYLDKHKMLKVSELQLMIKTIFDAMCEYKDFEMNQFLGTTLNIILHVLKKHGKQKYDGTIKLIHSFCKLLFPHAGIPSCSYELDISPIISDKTREAVSNDHDLFFTKSIAYNILLAIFGECEIPELQPDEVHGFWKIVCVLLIDEHENCNELFEIAVRIAQIKLRIYPLTRAVDFFAELTESIVRSHESIEETHAIYGIFHDFFEQYSQMLTHTKEYRANFLKWISRIMESYGNDELPTKLLKCFTDYCVIVAEAFDNWHDVEKRYTMTIMMISMARIKKILENFIKCDERVDILRFYLDIFATMMQLNRLFKLDFFYWIEAEVNVINSWENPKWPIIVGQFLTVQHQTCRQFFAKFAPTPEILWNNLQNGNSFANVIELTVLVATCPFANVDEGGKYLIPILVIPCLKDLQSKFGAKWDNFRIHCYGSARGSSHGSTRPLLELEKFEPVIEEIERIKIVAIIAAMQVQKKPNQLVQLVADMVVAVMETSKSKNIESVFATIRQFVMDNRSHGSDIANALIRNLARNDFKDATIAEMCDTAAVCISNYVNRGDCSISLGTELESSDFSDRPRRAKLDETALKGLVKKFSANIRTSALTEFIKFCKSVLLHCELSNCAQLFSPILKCLNAIRFMDNFDEFLRFWEIYEQTTGKRERISFYVAIFNPIFANLMNDPEAVTLINKISNSKLPENVHVAMYSALLANAAVINKKEAWAFLQNQTIRSCRRSVRLAEDDVEDDKTLREIFTQRFGAIIARSFIARLFENSEVDEAKMREILRNFLTCSSLLFQFECISNFLKYAHRNIIFWAMFYGATKPKHCCVVLDFLCQELITKAESMKPKWIPIELAAIKAERKKIISEVWRNSSCHPMVLFFEQNLSGIIQLWRLQCGENLEFWRFCHEFCDFDAEEIAQSTIVYRKDVTQKLLIVAAQDFLDPPKNHAFYETIRKTYESLHRGRKFSITSAMEYRSEGIDVILEFRQVFAKNEHFLYRHRAADSFLVVIQHISKQFFEENWWSILICLGYCPKESPANIQTWKIFIERVDYEILRNYLWRIISMIAKIDENEQLVRMVWKRLTFTNKLDVLLSDPTIQKLLWIIPHSMEVELRNDGTNVAKYRRIDDLVEIVANFERFPLTLFGEHLRLMIEQKTIWKEDLTRIIAGLVANIGKVGGRRENAEICRILEQVPIFNAELVDVGFVRWDMSARFYQTPKQRTQELLDECVLEIEMLATLARGGVDLDYADRTMCEVHKYLDNKDCKNQTRFCMIDGAKAAFARMNCHNKPEPKLICGENRPNSFHAWLTSLIFMCISPSDSQFLPLKYIAHVRDTSILTKIVTKLMLFNIIEGRETIVTKILGEFESVLHAALRRRVTRFERAPAAFVFYIFDFVYFYMNLDWLRSGRDNNTRRSLQMFWKHMIETTMKDELGHDAPLIVRVAERFGMEKRGILWMETWMELKANMAQGAIDKSSELSYYFTLMKLYARAHELTGVRGAYSRLSRIQVDHLYAKILIKEAFGNVNEASAFYTMADGLKHFEPTDIVNSVLEEINKPVQPESNAIRWAKHIDLFFFSVVSSYEKEQYEEYEKCLNHLKLWLHEETDCGESPQTFERNIEQRSWEAKVLRMLTAGGDEPLEPIIQEIGSKAIERIEEASFGGNCSYDSAIPHIVQLRMLDEITRLNSATNDELLNVDSELWTTLRRRMNESEQRLDVLEPVLRARRAVLNARLRTIPERDRDKIKSRIVETYLHTARVARLHDCGERAMISILNAKKIDPFDKRIVLELAKLRLQTADEETGMQLLDSLLATTFGELSKHFSDTQQSANLDLKSTALTQIENFPREEKNLYSEVQVLRIAQTIKSGNTIVFEKIYEETTNLLNSFVSSGVMYDAAWLLDYLFHYHEKNIPVLKILKHYREVAKYERNPVLQARAIERMVSLWLTNTRKLSLKDIGLKGFYPAYAILARQIDHPDMEVFSTIKRLMIQLIIRLPHQCMWQSVYILRSQDSKKIERYKEVLSHLRRKHACYSTLIDQYDYASAAFKAVADKVRNKSAILSEAVPYLKKLIRDRKYDPRNLEFERRNEAEKELMCGIMVPIRADIDASVQIAGEDLMDNDYTKCCEIAERFMIHDYKDSVKILASNTNPILIELTTQSGRKIRLICKKEDDLTKDYHFAKIVEMCNDLLTKDEKTRIRGLNATTYSVIPLAKTGGIIEFMEGVTPYYEALEPLLGLGIEKKLKWKNSMASMTREKKVEYFRDVCCKETPLVMAKWFRKQYPEAGKWFVSRKLFAKSAAVMSIIGFIFGLGDRHIRNLLIHVPTGKCVHVDFDMIFNMGDFLEVPEVVPFRLTRNMINGMGEVALDGEFRYTCEQTLRVFMANTYEIEKYIADLPDLVGGDRLTSAIQRIQQSGSRSFTYDMKEAKRMVSARLRGNIITAKIYKGNSISHPMKNVQLAASLIELATSDEKLAEMFHGWMPFV